MAHNARIRGAGDAWVSILPAEIAAFDSGLAAGINGDDGSTHAPTTPITIIGLGGLDVVGPTAITRGAIVTTAGSNTFPTVNLEDGDWPELEVGNPFRDQPRYQLCADAKGIPESAWCVRQENGGLQAFSPMLDLLDGQGMRPARAYLRLRAHDNATLTSVTVFFHVGWPHTALPSIMPSVRVLRLDAPGNVVAMTSAAAGADPNGYVYVPRPTTAAQWTNNFQQQAIEVPCDQNNLVDTSQYSYIVELVEEQGLTGYPWQLTWFFDNIVAATVGANVTLSGAQIIDTIALGTGDFILVKDQTDPNENGIYEVLPGTWARVAYGFSQGFVVPVLLGAINGGTWWQASSFVTQWNPIVIGTTSAPNPISFVPQTIATLPSEGTAFFAHGILWQCAIVDYANIPDLRPG